MFKKILPQSGFGQTYISIFAGITVLSVVMTAATAAADAVIDSL